MKELQIIPFTQLGEQVWTDFHQSCEDPVVFYQYEFLRGYAEAANERLDLLLYKENSKLLIALPGSFNKTKRIFYNLTYFGWDNLNFLMVKEIDALGISSFFKELLKVVDLVVYKNINESCYQTISTSTFELTSFKGFRCPFIPLKEPYRDYLEGLSVSFKRMVKNRTNFCIKHGIEFKFLSNLESESFEEAFADLIRLHSLRMDEVEIKSKFLRTEPQRFHRILRDNRSKEFIQIIQAVEGEKVVGTLYGFVSSNRCAYLASGIDPDYSKYSLGIVLIGKLIDYSISRNYEYFDFLRGTEDYKFKWTQETNQNYTVYAPTNFLGKAKALKVYWDENKRRLGRKQTLLNLKKFF